MKKTILILFLLIPGYLFGQQFPYMDSYSVNPFNFSPAYAGISHIKDPVYGLSFRLVGN